MENVNLYEGVELTRDTGNLKAGSHGVVVDLYDGGRVAEVEFMDSHGDTVAVEPIDASLLRVIADTHGRPLLNATAGTKR